jgi:hypothetical protein
MACKRIAAGAADLCPVRPQAASNAQHVVGVSLQFRLAKSFDVPTAGRAFLFASLPECAINSQSECAKGHRDQPSLPNRHFDNLLARSPLEWPELAVRHRVPQPSGRGLVFSKQTSPGDVCSRPKADVEWLADSSSHACSNSCRLEPRWINSCDPYAPRSGKAPLDDRGPT